MIETKEQYTFAVEEHFIVWCTGGTWFNQAIFQNLHDPIFEALFVTARQDICDLICGLHVQDKKIDKSTDATNFGDGRPLP